MTLLLTFLLGVLVGIALMVVAVALLEPSAPAMTLGDAIGALAAFVAGLVAGLVAAGLGGTPTATVILLTGERVLCPYGVTVSVGRVLCRVDTKDGAAGFIHRGWDLAEVDVVDIRL